MTTFDRIERRLPQLIDELAAATVPDYFDDMLQHTSRSRQRPAWSPLERWLPMGVIARPVPIRPVPWRPIAIAALITLLAAATLIYVGSRTRTPPPFGLARNGVLVIGTADGDLATVDPATGTTTPLITGPTLDSGPYFSNDGRRILFDRRQPGAADSSVFLANADGSDVRPAFPNGPAIDWFDWSPSGDRAVITEVIDGKGRAAIADLVTGARTPLALDPDLDVVAAMWRPNHDQLVLTAKDGSDVTFWVADTSGGGLRQIPVSTYAINQPTLSPDGTTLAYATWEPTVPPGRIRVVDIDSGDDHEITTNHRDGYVWQTPQFSPDGTHLLLNRFLADVDPPAAQLAIMDVADGSATAVGPVSENPQPAVLISPDGTKILASYSTLGKTWIFDGDGGNGHDVSFDATGGIGWQRLAP